MPAIDFDPRRIDAIFAPLDQGRLPGAAVGIAIAGRPVYRKAFGLASMELPIALSPAMRMRIASVSKHFACLAYLLLCEEGAATLDDPIGEHLPELHPLARRATLRQLMGNTSGLRDVHDLAWQFSGTGRAVSSEALVSLYSEIDDVNAPPGAAWIYNNGGFLLLTAAIERISGRSLEDFLRERIFDPAGMYDTLLRRFDTDFVPNSASLHMPRSGGGFDKSRLGVAFAGEGGVVSTVDDMLRWLAHMSSPLIGAAGTWQALRTPQRLTSGAPTGYALGLVAGDYRGVGALSHPGGAMGGSAHMLKMESLGLDLAIMTNRGDVWATLLAQKVIDACVTGLEPLSGFADRPLASGVFTSPRTGRVIQLFARADQQIASVDGTDTVVEPDEQGLLRPAGLSRHVKQSIGIIGDPARPAVLRFSEFRASDELVRREPAASTLSRIAGRYRAATLGIEATIDGTDGDVRLTTRGRFGSTSYPLECLTEGVWRAQSPTVTFLGGVLSFDADGGGFRFSNAPTRALSFRRVP